MISIIKMDWGGGSTLDEQYAIVTDGTLGGFQLNCNGICKGEPEVTRNYFRGSQLKLARKRKLTSTMVELERERAVRNRALIC